jgi:hypothetical protein
MEMLKSLDPWKPRNNQKLAHTHNAKAVNNENYP